MADEEHLSILKGKGGVSAWNEWRSEHPEIFPDLSEADLNGADLSKADLHGADLRGAYLNQADLSRANLLGTNLRGATLIKANLSGAALIRANLLEAVLRKAELTEANLGGASLSRANLRGATLHKADLRKAELTEANLRGAKLNRADLSGADLIEADLGEVDLSGADLSGADLSGANLNQADLDEVDLHNSVMGFTSVVDVDLGKVKGLETVIHYTPSSIGIDTIYRSKGKIPKVFLEGAGVPEKFILYMDSLMWEGFEFYSCFISYSAKEEDFARRLYDDMKRREVRCWFFPEDAKWGEPVWGEIDRATKLYDKLVVICSENSLQSGAVLREIDRALQREDREKKNILFPVRLDDFLFEKWEHQRKADVVSKVAGDFRDRKDQKAYGKALDRLVQALNKPQDKDKA